VQIRKYPEILRAFFDKVEISGTWIALDIRTSMFVNLDYDNSLRDVFALTDNAVVNNVTIENVFIE